MKIIGIGNALIDVLAKLEDDTLLEEMNLPKGSMNLVDRQTRNALLNKLKKHDLKLTTGGSAGNTCLAMAHLGMPVGFVGKVGDDAHGQFFVKEYTESGINPHFIHETNPSGTAMVMISPDGERTFCTYLGVAAEMNHEEIIEDILKDYTHIYIEGYLVQNHALIEKAFAKAKRLGLTTAIDLASFNVVEEEREFLQTLIEKYVDIVFANETEAKALTGKEPEEAIRIIAEHVHTAVVKIGDQGSLVLCEGELVHVPVDKIQAIDTTAAGDYYAAGFFYGLSKKWDLVKSAQAGSVLAGEIIQVIGTKLSEETWAEIKQRIE